MAQGPGKYDEECTLVREATNARLVAVIVLGGDKGGGFSVQSVGPPELMRILPDLLESMAREIRDGA